VGLGWARRRSDDIVRDIVDAELLDLMRLEPTAPATPAPASIADAPQPSGAAKRRWARHEDERRLMVAFDAWDEIVELCSKDISHGGMFVQTVRSPPMRTRVEIGLELPDEAGHLRLPAEVVHIVTAEQAAATGVAPGFGAQFLDLTPDLRAALERLVEHAKRRVAGSSGPTLADVGFVCAQSSAGLRLVLDGEEIEQLRRLRAELAAMQSRGDLELLGLDPDYDTDELGAAFARLSQQWRPTANDRAVTPEVRRLAAEIHLRLESAFRRLSVNAAFARARTASRATTEAVPTAAPRAEPEAQPVAQPQAQPQPPQREPEPRRGGAPESQRSRVGTFVARVLEQGQRLTSRLARPAATPTSATGTDAMLREAATHVGQKRYAEAIAVLERLVERQPDHARAQVLLRFAAARKAVVERNFAAARRAYEELLQIDPENRIAQRELVLIACLQ
jgi:hypothetical protein